MSELTHTPKSWKLLEVGDSISRLCPANQENQSILTIVEEDGVKFAAVFENEDANLIVAAPDLLDACMQAAELFEDNERIAQVLLSAISKATGVK